MLKTSNILHHTINPEAQRHMIFLHLKMQVRSTCLKSILYKFFYKYAWIESIALFVESLYLLDSVLTYCLSLRLLLLFKSLLITL